MRCVVLVLGLLALATAAVFDEHCPTCQATIVDIENGLASNATVRVACVLHMLLTTPNNKL